MLKKLAILGLCAAAAVAAVPAQAQTQYKLVSVCAVPAYCPLGPNPATLGPYPDLATCQAAYALWSQGPFNQYPRTLTYCIPV